MRFYRALLHLFPRSFRAEYGGEMTKDFSREWNEAGGAKATLLISTILDVAANAMRVHYDILKQDVGYAMRSLRRTPGFTLTAILVAGLGIGATTATFSLADHVLIRALPFPQPDELVRVWEDHAARGYPQLEPSPPAFLDWKRTATSFERLEAYSTTASTMTGRGEAARVSGAFVTAGMMPMLGRQAALGRILTDSDVNATDQPIVVSDRFWRTTLGASRDAVGQSLTLDDRTVTIVGVMPADFYFPYRDVNFWSVLTFAPERGDGDRTNHYLAVLGRLKDGVSAHTALAEIRQIGSNLARAYPKELEGTSATLAPLRDQVAWQARQMLWGLVAASMCVLLIACTNLANLLMSRALARRGEFAVRAAVGASVDRLVRQMLTDSLLLALCGGVLGIVLAVGTMPLLVRLVPTALPIAELPSIDLRMLAGTLVLTMITGLAFGLLPALRISRAADASTLKEGIRGGTGRSTERLRSSLVVAEIVASIVVIVSVALLSRALIAVQQVDPGFHPENLLTMRTQLPFSKYGNLEPRLQFYARVLDRLQALPGVERASYTSFLPMTFRGGIWEVLSTTPDASSQNGFAQMPEGQRDFAGIRFVTPGFFATIGTPVVKGRDISAADTVDTPDVAVVSESFARRYFPGQDPLGRSFAIAFAARTIVGVVGDIKFRGLERISEPQVYMPAAQQQTLLFYAPKDLVIRARVPATTLAPAVRAIIAGAEPDLPVTAVQTMEQVIAGETAPRVAQLRVLAGFAVLAVILAAIGIHGLLSFTVSSRSREIGVRMTLGAKARDIIWMVLGRSARLALVGTAVGAALAYAAGRSMQALLFGVDPADAVTFAAAAALSVLMTLAGSLLPAWRAIRVDPITATRAD